MTGSGAAVQRAFAIADTERLTILVESTGWVGYFGMRLEVGDWASEACHLTGRPPTFAVAARFAAQFGDADEAERLAQAGIAAAPYPTHPSTSGCHWGYAVAAWYTGRSADTWSRFMTLDSIEPESPLDAVHTAITGAVMAAALAPEQTAHFLARAEKAATALPSTGFDAMLAWAKSIVLSFAGREAEALEALQQVDTLEDDTTFLPVTMWTSMQRAVLLSNSGMPDAAEAWAAALRRLYDHRNHAMTLVALERITLWWARLGTTDAAAVVIGYLNAHQHGHAAMVEQRAELNARLTTDQHAQAHLAHGARLTRDNLIAYVLHELAHNAHTATTSEDEARRRAPVQGLGAIAD